MFRVAVMLGLVAGAVGATGPNARAASDEDDLIQRGVQLRKEQDDRAALEVFKRAYAIHASPRAAGQLGLCEQALGRWEDAEQHVIEARRATGDAWVKKNRAALEAALATIRSHVAHLELTGQPPGAEIFVNGVSVGHLPLAGPLAVSAGDVVLELRAPGYRNSLRQVKLEGAQYQRVYVQLESASPDAERPGQADRVGGIAAPSPVGPAPRPSPAAGAVVPSATSAAPAPAETATVREPAPDAARPLLIATWVAGGLAAAGLATGVIASVIHHQKVSDFQSADNGGCYDRGGRAVTADGNLAPSDCQSLLDSYKSARTWQIVGFTAAGVFAASFAVLQILRPRPAETSRVAWSCAPSVDPGAGEAGAACALRF